METNERSQQRQRATTIMSTHPSSDNRINSLNKWIPKIILEYPPLKV